MACGFQDGNAATAMRHARPWAREVWVRFIFQHHPQACNALTWSSRTPGRRSSLQCLVDNVCPRGAD
eukprot:11219846-Lingulodinium_polyedra.AAC.1